ncbi:MAG: flavohemoglobin expression-modulating QEGLA motif protein [Deferrisomatales bacterium]
MCRRLRNGQRVRRNLPVWGRVHIDRPLPFLCVYRKPAGREDAGTDRLAASEASYLVCSASRRLQEGLQTMVAEIARVLGEQFGACLVLELWSAPSRAGDSPATTTTPQPEFRVVAPRSGSNGAFTDEFVAALSRVRLGRRRALVKRSIQARCAPPSLPPILTPERAAQVGAYLYGLEVAPVYRDGPSGEVFPQLLRQLRRELTVALRRAFFQFARTKTAHRPAHYHALGRRAVVKAVWEADKDLADAAEQFDFLLLASPINGEQAWGEFQRGGYRVRPTLLYRPLPADPVVLKRRLYKAPVERVEDPALAQLFREKLDELDRQITMLQDRNTPRFLLGSVQAYGHVEEELHELALEILRDLPPRSREERSGQALSPEEFAELARAEIDRLREQLPSIDAKVEVRGDVTGLMVSQGNLLIGSRMRVPLSRAEALIQHEVGTHVLTYHNGKAQRFRQLATGLAGYDALQEGLAVLAEYLAGGLTRARLRLLAGRVVAARLLLDRAGFPATFRTLQTTYGFAKRTAFLMTLRTFRSGGLTKDAVYLRGLCQILDHLGRGGELEPLLAGKIAAHHIPIVRELQWRGVLEEPPLLPTYLSRPDAVARLEALRQGPMRPQDLLAKRSPS